MFVHDSILVFSHGKVSFCTDVLCFIEYTEGQFASYKHLYSMILNYDEGEDDSDGGNSFVV